MRKTILSLSFILAASVGFTHAQDVLKKHGFKKKPLTFCDGQYNEFFNNPEVVQIGTTLFNTRTNKVVKLLDENTPKTTYKAESSSMCIDPHAEKYYSISPYAYCAGNPVNRIDGDGRDIIVLNAPKGAGGYGHMAMLVGNNKTGGWDFISKEGRDKSPWYSNELTGGPASTPKMRHFKTQAEFDAFRKNNLKEYTQDVRFTTNSDQDKAAKEATTEAANSWYQFASSNCADAVSDGLEAAGLDPGYIVDNPNLKATLDPRPNERFKKIKENNEDKTPNQENNTASSNTGMSWQQFGALATSWLQANPNIQVTVKN